MVGGGEARRALISLNTRTPLDQNKRIHLRATTKDTLTNELPYLLCLNSKARWSFKQRHLSGGDDMSDAELIPDLSVIVHGRIVKGGLVWVKEIVNG